MSRDESCLALASPIDLALTGMSHGWAHLAPWQWDPERCRLARRERIGGRLGQIAISQRDRGAVTINVAGFDTTDLPEIRRRVERWLSADWSPLAAIAALRRDFPEGAALIEAGGGRLLRGSSFYEDFVKTVLTINTGWASTCRMAAALVDEPGGGCFPTPQAVLDYGEDRLRRQARLGFRAGTLAAATRQLLADRVISPAGEGEPEILSHDYLIALKGIGPYAAAHCRLLLHDFARIPVDSEVTAYLRTGHDLDPAEFAASRAGWGAYLALGYKLMRLREKLDRASTPALDAQSASASLCRVSS